VNAYERNLRANDEGRLIASDQVMTAQRSLSGDHNLPGEVRGIGVKDDYPNFSCATGNLQDTGLASRDIVVDHRSPVS